jgi:hypothetical protein
MTKYATQEERDSKTKEGTLSLCRKTAAASRDGDTRHEQNGGVRSFFWGDEKPKKSP